MGTELNQALVQQAFSFAPETTEERQAVKVWEDGTVEFYLYAPTAETVEVAGVGGYFDAAPLALLPDGNGGFYRKIENFPRGMHYYHWFVDGVKLFHPKAGFSYGCFETINTFEVPERGAFRGMPLRLRECGMLSSEFCRTGYEHRHTSILMLISDIDVNNINREFLKRPLH